ncbi:unnamed protein product [Boreogadus saida]
MGKVRESLPKGQRRSSLACRLIPLCQRKHVSPFLYFPAFSTFTPEHLIAPPPGWMATSQFNRLCALERGSQLTVSAF